MRRAKALYAATPAAFKKEVRDCGVRALRVAAGCTYEQAHKTLGIYGRIARRGTYNRTMHISAGLYGLKPVATMAGGVGVKLLHPTLAQFAAAHRSGAFVLRVHTHFIALVDGVVHDWYASKTGARTRVVAAWGHS